MESSPATAEPIITLYDPETLVYKETSPPDQSRSFRVDAEFYGELTSDTDEHTISIDFIVTRQLETADETYRALNDDELALEFIRTALPTLRANVAARKSVIAARQARQTE